jgi:hypothetical protein
MLIAVPITVPSHPVIWSALGYEFEAASMLAALLACLVVRVWVCLTNAPTSLRARGLNLSITAIALLFTIGWVMLQRPSPFYGLLSGSGFAALGSGLISISLNWVKQLDPVTKPYVPDPVGTVRPRADGAPLRPAKREK